MSSLKLVMEDNEFAISTTTAGKTFYSTPDGDAEEFYGIPIRYVNGRDLSESYVAFGETVSGIRKTRKPAIVVMRVDRLSNHTNADDQSVYRSYTEIEEIRAEGDPLIEARAQLNSAGIEASSLIDLEAEVKQLVKSAAEKARREKEPRPEISALR